jgi:hypothetical protein
MRACATPADRIMIQPDLALGGFKTALNGPASLRHAHHIYQRGFLRRKDHIGPHQQLASPGAIQGIDEGANHM